MGMTNMILTMNIVNSHSFRNGWDLTNRRNLGSSERRWNEKARPCARIRVFRCEMSVSQVGVRTRP